MHILFRILLTHVAVDILATKELEKFSTLSPIPCATRFIYRFQIQNGKVLDARPTLG
jgi:hypothetical protein